MNKKKYLWDMTKLTYSFPIKVSSKIYVKNGRYGHKIPLPNGIYKLLDNSIFKIDDGKVIEYYPIKYKMSEETKKLIQKKRKWYHHSKETKEILRKKSLLNKSGFQKGHKVSDETGVPLSEEAKEKIRKFKLEWWKNNKNRVVSEETRKKMGDAHRGRKYTTKNN